MPGEPSTAAAAEDVAAPAHAGRADGAILLIPFTWVGDVVKAHSLVRLLAERRPQAAVDLLVPPHLALLVACMPGVRRAVVADLPRHGLGWPARVALARRLRSARYAEAIILPGTLKAALAPFLAGIPRRTGWLGEWRIGLVNDLRAGEKRLSINDRMLHLGLARGETSPAAWPAPQLVADPLRLAAWRQREGLDPAVPLLGLAPGSTAAARRWPAERFAALAQRATARGFTVMVLGGAAESEAAATIVAAAGPTVRDYTGTPLDEAVLQAHAATVVVANDSGLLHVAAAAGAPVVGLFGASDAARTGPIGARPEIVDIALPCRPCYAAVCPLGHHGCMTGIAVEAVEAAVERVLDRS